MEKVAKPQYTKSDNETIFQELRQDVSDLVLKLEAKRRGNIVFKAILFPALYIFVYVYLLSEGSNPLVFFSCYFLLGLLLVAIFLNIIHDAVHGTIFKNSRLNNWYVYFFDLMGANSYIWRIRHIRFHHNYPNVDGWDTDFEQSGLARVFPTGRQLPRYRYQHIYLPLLYPFYLLNWLFIRDFKDFFNKKKTIWKLIDIPAKEYIKFFFFKGIFLLCLLLLPQWFLAVPWLKVLAGFLLMMFTASILSLMVLLSPHANSDSEFPLPDAHNKLPHSWMMHMLKTTNDVTHDNWFTRFFMGCFNYHIVHHLFPNVNHVYYPEVTKLLKDFAGRHNLPYREYSLAASLKSHYKLLKSNSITEDIFDEAM